MGDNKVFVLRHGHIVRRDGIKNLDAEKYEDQANYNIGLIRKHINPDKYEKLVFHTSEHPRCRDTAELIISKLKKHHPNIKTEVVFDTNLDRWNSDKGEKRSHSFERSKKYGGVIKKMLEKTSKDICHFYFTHCSVIFTLVEGILGKSIKKPTIKYGAIYVLNFKKHVISEENIKKR